MCLCDSHSGTPFTRRCDSGCSRVPIAQGSAFYAAAPATEALVDMHADSEPCGEPLQPSTYQLVTNGGPNFPLAHLALNFLLALASRLLNPLEAKQSLGFPTAISEQWEWILPEANHICQKERPLMADFILERTGTQVPSPETSPFAEAASAKRIWRGWRTASSRRSWTCGGSKAGQRHKVS